MHKVPIPDITSILDIWRCFPLICRHTVCKTTHKYAALKLHVLDKYCAQSMLMLIVQY